MEFKKIKYVNRITNKIDTENVPAENFMKFLYYNPFGKLPLEAIGKRKFLSAWYGRKMDTAKSCGMIEEFVKNNNINLGESVKSLGEFKSFNDFFIRELKPGARKIDYNEGVLSSPADGKVFVVENFKGLDKFFVKGEEFSFNEFFGDEKLAAKYEGGTFVIIRLAPADYHRFHFPADGIISGSKKIDGDYYSVSPHAIRKNFRIFCENKREYSILKTEEFGEVAIVEVGATMVGGIKQTYKANSTVKKGQEKGYFYFGGSTTILVFEKGKVKIDEDILKNSSQGLETKVFMGERIGKSY